MSRRAEARELLAAERGYRVYGYRWVVLGVVMVVNFMIQVLWIGYGSIIADAADYYGVSHQLVTLLAMVFMIAFIPLSLPAAWVARHRQGHSGGGGAPRRTSLVKTRSPAQAPRR